MGIQTINESESYSLRTSFEQLKNNPQRLPQWFEELSELRNQAKAQDNLALWIEISNQYIESGTRNSKIKEAFLILEEVLELINSPDWNPKDLKHLNKLRGDNLIEAGRLYNLLNRPDEALVYIERAEQIAKSIQAHFLLVKAFMSKEASLNLKGNHQELSAFQLKNIQFYKKFVKKYPEKIRTLLLAYTNIALCYSNVDDTKNELKYIEKAYQLLNKSSNPNNKIYIISVFILLILDQSSIEDKDLTKAKNLFREVESIDKTLIDHKLVSIYLLAQGHIQTANKDYQSAKKTLNQVVQGRTYSHNIYSALSKLIEIHHLENNLEGIQNCFKLQQEISNNNYDNLKANEMAKQEALYEVKQLKVAASYNKKILKAERELREKIEEKQKKILKLNKELDFFSGMMAHDLKAPLKTIESFLGLIHKRNQEKLEEKDQDFFCFIFEAIGRMNVLVDQLLSHAKMGGIGITLEPINLEEQLLLVKGNLQAIINEKNATINIEGPLPQIIGEPTYLKVLFQNLFSNAIKFTPTNRNPSIHVSSEEKEQYFCILIKDNGIGIPQDLLKKVTQPFYRVHNQAKYKGAGLGLATCQKIMNIHQGNLSIASQEGEGSTFSLNFPKEITATDNNIAK